MEKEQLLELIDSWDNLNFIVREAVQNPDLFSLLMNITLNAPEQKTWRAAYLVDKIHDDFPELILPYLDRMVAKLPEEKNLSKKRHLLKLISMNAVPEKHFSFLLDFCMETMASDEPPAVRVHAMQILFNISEKEPELKPEILALIEHEMEYHATAGILSRGKKIAKKLQKQINLF